MHARAFAILLAASLTAGCAGAASVAPIGPQPSSGTGALVPQTVAAPNARGVARPSKKRRASLSIRFRIPRRHRHAGHFIGPDTQGALFTFSGATTVTQAIGLTPASDPNCSDVSGVTTCTIALSIFSGNYTATVATYAVPPASGAFPAGAAPLATANESLIVVAGRANLANFTLEGIPATLAIASFPTGGSANTAFATPAPFEVTAKDSAGETIVGDYGDPVTFTDSDTSGATTVVTAGSDSPPKGTLLSSSDTAVFNYSGLAIATATVQAVTKEASSDAVTFTPVLQPIGPSSLTSGVSVNVYVGTHQTFTVSEPGWSNAPYSKSFTTSGCTNVFTITPSSGTTFSAALSGQTASGTCTLTISDGAGQTLRIPFGYQAFVNTNGAQTFTVPAGISALTIEVDGASGGTGVGLEEDSPGGITIAGIPTGALSSTLDVEVGGEGGNGATTSPYYGAGGYNGGGSGSYASSCGTASSITAGGGGGGGASDVRSGTGGFPLPYADRIIIGGGAGGWACQPFAPSVGGDGGNGGSTTSGGSAQNGTGYETTGGGLGGSTAGGNGGTSCSVSYFGNAGGLGVGGNGAYGAEGAGGGGGGYYGGGGGGAAPGIVDGCATLQSGGGGGGSSYVEPAATLIYSAQGLSYGSGYVVIAW